MPVIQALGEGYDELTVTDASGGDGRRRGRADHLDGRALRMAA
jgi:hypothetical protein